MEDRELLELAGWANGFEEFSGQMIESGWNPLADDGDALRLAVKLGMAISIDNKKGCTNAICDEGCEFPREWHDENGGDVAVATRRAIVRSAAELGHYKKIKCKRMLQTHS